MPLYQTILKDLVLDYQKTKSAVTFSKILKRVDKLLLTTIHKHVRRRNLVKIDLRDLYHSSIVGLGRAVMTSPKNEEPRKIIARIIAYVRLEIDNDFWKKHKPSDEKRVPLSQIDFRMTNESLFNEVECAWLIDNIVIMIREETITQEEARLFLSRVVSKTGYSEIGSILGITRDGARKRLQSIEQRIAQWIEERRIANGRKNG